jgi:hypothetical protein
MKFLGLVMLLAFVKGTSAQIKTITLSKEAIPKSMHYTGHIINAVRYIDSEGEHIIISTETGNVDVKEEGNSYLKADLYAYNYLINGNQQTLSWQMHDFTIVCPVDTKAKYIPNTFAVTDLNKDGKAEVWLMYITGCRGDVSSGSMKIIMHEGSKKYAIRGSSRVQIMDKQYDGGEYTLDDAFKTAPTVFKQYALALWKKNLMED